MTRRRWLPPSLAVMLVAASLASMTSSAAAADPQIAYERYVLPNGLEVILHQDQSVPLVAVDVWYHVGSGDETPGKSGFAHLFEHMMFQGTKHTGEDVHFPILKSIGASMVNGSTSPNRTNYYEVVPAHQLETALWLESERMGYMLPQLNEASLANQRGVVTNERRQNYDSKPYSPEYFRVAELLFPDGHPYRYTTIGRFADIAGASSEDVRAFFRKWYAPANATLVIAGDFEKADAHALVDKWFGGFPRTEKPAHQTVATPVIGTARRETVKDPFARLRRIHYAWHTPALYAPGDAELDLLASTLGREGTGRLYRILVHDRQLVQELAVYQESRGLSSIFHVVADLRQDADQAEVEKIIDQELERAQRELLTARELARAVIQYESGFIWGLEGLLARAELLQGYNHFTGDPAYLSRDLDRYRSATPEKVRAAAARYLAAKARVEVITAPAAGGK